MKSSKNYIKFFSLFNIFSSFFYSVVLANYPKTGPSSRDPRMTSMFRRGTIFATFFLSLLGGGLVCAALVTQHWVEARPWRTPNPQESAGRVHFGLLQGKKELNVAYGWRTYHVSGMLVFSAFLFVQRRLRLRVIIWSFSYSMTGYRNLEGYAFWLIVCILIGKLICETPLAFKLCRVVARYLTTRYLKHVSIMQANISQNKSIK